MVTFVTAALAAATALAAPDAQPTNLPGIFGATCLDGQARLSASDVSPISFNQLPSALRDRLGQPASSKVWKLNTSGNAYLYVLEYPEGPGLSPKICGLASDAMDLGTAADALQVRIAGPGEKNRARSTQWVNVKDGYVAMATTASSFNVLQISWMSDDDKYNAQDHASQMTH